jgi:hypothetical protein
VIRQRQLAVVVDDYLAGVNQVVRGSDLLHSTPRQIFLQRRLGYPSLSYLHVPVAINATGAIAALLGERFVQRLARREVHVTPRGMPQAFTWAAFERVG